MSLAEAALPSLAPPGAERHWLRLRHDLLSYLEWPARGRARRGSILLLHGLQSTALTMARVGEGLARRGWHVIAPDLPGHGHSFALDGSDTDRPGRLDISRAAVLRHRLSRRHRLGTTAAVIADLAGRLGLERPAVLGHSWGASVGAVLPSAGLVPSVLVLLDPPFVTASQARTQGMRIMAEPTRSYDAARDALLERRSDWHPLDLAAKAEALTSVSTRAMVAIVARNVPFDPVPALARLRQRHPETAVFVIMGEPGQGSFVSPEGQASLRALLGDDHVLLMPGAGHSPHRAEHDAFMDVLVGALGGRPATRARPQRAARKAIARR